MTLRLKLAVLATALGLAACSSPTMHYYTLVAPLHSEATSGAPAPFQFEMLPVLLPVQVDQPPLVVRQGDGSLAILDTERWGAPLGDEFHDALTAQLEQRWGRRDMAGLPKEGDLPVLSLRTDVRRFESVPGQYALLDVVWNLSLRGGAEGGKRQTLTCSSVIREQAGSGLDSLVIAHQKAISRLADSIARGTQAWVSQPGKGCP
ncbi:PqiC family protein [Pseudomonas sp. DTU_2021_1001937_2_SI_NGA_ILE_001]|uniref:PqiC family protein n=1 Tax=Pseudomonas sp. DTU_2021_1001937_2_SI_NGA_ILE_001 TaxID=3077589 RepID=UPI0028FC2402|nr:PqiC family protein [Pseudomonas sp. DTU_2021_1001937_2_SI_NGA_ILE_001]WNW10518.1 PqiC family protein [Pseudomonas sp. DTU_2021_1001937_2_SI_NGA_ILE_001]